MNIFVNNSTLAKLFVGKYGRYFLCRVRVEIRDFGHNIYPFMRKADMNDVDSILTYPKGEEEGRCRDISSPLKGIC